MRQIGPFPTKILALALFGTLLTAPAGAAAQIDSPDTDLWVVAGRGTAHGFGMAIDGVIGMANSGADHNKILNTFYSGVSEAQVGGNIRVGLGSAASHTITLPGGGTVNVPGEAPKNLPADSTVVVRYASGRYEVEYPGLVAAAQIPGVGASPTPAPATPTPTATASPSPTPMSGVVTITPKTIAKASVTSRRYVGTLTVTNQSSGLWLVNTVDLETYVGGIAEEKGRPVPVETLRAMAIAARTHAVAARDWYTRNHVNGFDICTDSNCQVYLGEDGDPRMKDAARVTKGRILTYGGRAILAMYHGNGGGMTETDPNRPWLKGIRYPGADPKVWTMRFTDSELRTGLASVGVSVGAIDEIRAVEFGAASPRVQWLTINGSVRVSGTRFQQALELPSTWFSVSRRASASLTATGRVSSAPYKEVSRGGFERVSAGIPATPQRPVIPAAAVLCLAAAVIATQTRRRSA